jgi:hypothetical protein
LDELLDLSENIDTSTQLEKITLSRVSPVRPTKQPNMLRIIKMNAEKIRNKDLNLILSASDPKVKDAKPKVQSFQKNYYKPLFLP